MEFIFTQSLLELREAFCYYSRPIYKDESPRSTYFNGITILRSTTIDNQIKSFRWMLTYDLRESQICYELINNFEEISLLNDGSLVSRILNRIPIIEDFDHNLPPDQNLWQVLTTRSTDYYRKERVKALLEGTTPSTDPMSNSTKQFLRQIINNQEAFEWIYDIVIHKRLTEKVQIVMEDVPSYFIDFDEVALIRQKIGLRWNTLRDIFSPFSQIFIRTNFYSSLYETLDVDYRPEIKENAWFYYHETVHPMKQIRLGHPRGLDIMRHSNQNLGVNYTALCQFLEEEKRRYN